ncbi:hypothetical protein [Mucilaginibacter paludis]|nr:hypothetical protein [Mucilaginibacter paludis]
MKVFFLFIILLVCRSAFGQKYMILGQDTLPYKVNMIISSDTTYKGGLTLIKIDTSYQDRCYVFEKRNGKIVNRTDRCCLRQGLWIFTDSVGNYSTCFYTDGNDFGKWKSYNKYGKLLKETEEVSLGQKHYITKEIDYSGCKAVTIVNMPFWGFYITYFFIVIPILVFLSIVRILLNHHIYNIENNTNYSLFGNRFKLAVNESGQLRHELLSTFTIFFFRYKPENKPAVVISNLLSLLCFGSYAILIIGPMACR